MGKALTVVPLLDQRALAPWDVHALYVYELRSGLLLALTDQHYRAALPGESRQLYWCSKAGTIGVFVPGCCALPARQHQLLIKKHAHEICHLEHQLLNVRLPQLLDWLQVNPVDAIGLQELKLTDDKFPLPNWKRLAIRLSAMVRRLITASPF